MNMNPILSVCIPTNGMTAWVVATVKSIYAQGVDARLYDVVVADNACNHELESALQRLGHANLRYLESKQLGFLNQKACLAAGRGRYRKMLNHRSILRPGTLKRWINIIRKYEDRRPNIFFLDGKIGGGEIVCSSLDEFLILVHYWFTWSLGIGVWCDDIGKLDVLAYDSMFPHASIMFGLTQVNKGFLIVDEKFQDEQDDSGKGGYDLFKTFSVDALDLIADLRRKGLIETSTFIYVKNKMLLFLSNLYLSEVLCRSRHTFIIQNIEESLSVYYGNLEIAKMKMFAYVHIPRRCLGRILRWVRKLILRLSRQS